MRTVSSYGVELRKQNIPVRQTLEIYRSAVSYLTEIYEQVWEELAEIPDAKRRFNAAEHLVHTTKKNPARFDFDLRFPKMPSYLRRAAIQHALGSVSSYETRMELWEKSGEKAGKPRLAYENHAMPVFYRDVMYREEKEGKDEQVITYTDVVGTLMSSVTTIVDTISYVLIAFVAISLVVSSIMIGVITYISVLERKKEIGILRAIGASKRNVSQVFNAETFIIGLCAGVIGIGLTLLLLIPGNAIIHNVADNAKVNAVLPIVPAIILILLSVVLTLLGGLIPSKKAAKSDPVTALRTE